MKKVRTSSINITVIAKKKAKFWRSAHFHTADVNDICCNSNFQQDNTHGVMQLYYSNN